MEGGSGTGGNNGIESEWRFLIDENLSPNIVTELECRDIAAEYVLDALFEGADDFEDILPYCRQTDTVLVTNNVRDFNATDLSRPITPVSSSFTTKTALQRRSPSNYGELSLRIRIATHSAGSRVLRTGPEIDTLVPILRSGTGLCVNHNKAPIACGQDGSQFCSTLKMCLHGRPRFS